MVRRTRRRVVSVESPYVCWVTSHTFLDMVTAVALSIRGNLA